MHGFYFRKTKIKKKIIQMKIYFMVTQRLKQALIVKCGV